MAAFNADVLLDLQTTKAEREVKKFERSIDRLERKASDIDVKFDVDDRELRRAGRLLDRLSAPAVSDYGLMKPFEAPAAVMVAVVLPGLLLH